MLAARLWMVAAYLAAGVVAVATAVAIPAQHPIAVAFAADVAATIVIFGFSVAFRNSSFYDPYWSVAPIAIAAYFALGAASADAVPTRQLLVTGLVIVWGVRLTGNWARGWRGLDHEDWRYIDLRAQTGRAYWAVSFLGIHLMPTLWVFAGCLSLYPALAVGGRPLGLLDVVALAVTAGAIALETQADRELKRFRRGSPPADAILDTGLWAVSRHPNYLGEMGFWWGLYGFALAADPAWWWAAGGPISITLMFRFVSLPMIETRMLARRPGFAEHARRVPMVIPRLSRRRG